MVAMILLRTLHKDIARYNQVCATKPQYLIYHVYEHDTWIVKAKS
jgi:hypothetical protein